MWTTIQNLACDFGGYSGAKVTVYIDEGLEGVGAIPRSNVTCDFTSDSFDLKVIGLNGRNYRVVKRNLEKDIDPAGSILKVRKNKVILKLAKVEGEYGFESWTRLTSTKSKEKKRAAKKDPLASIMDMMKEQRDSLSESYAILKSPMPGVFLDSFLIRWERRVAPVDFSR